MLPVSTMPTMNKQAPRSMVRRTPYRSPSQPTSGLMSAVASHWRAKAMEIAK